MMTLHLIFAGISGFVWTWGIGVGIIILCLAGAFFSAAIPVIGPWLGTVRRDLEWIAVATAVFLMAHALGVHAEAGRCAAKSAVIEKAVKNAVDSTDLPRAEQSPDPYDNPEN